ncbi:MAG: hypothetical protein E6G98_14265 [Bacillati bacterium ANGP1]|uniref:YCII-related domain-containing protein n=1 Tax=Candidatus Segetimicrobium genomatis TaxID=2569760 RepID=A0A537LFK3_9BACT|nr:MAG: hypothetical protein E6G98_14265 [Terrabacteria group bacterium ANGP1]
MKNYVLIYYGEPKFKSHEDGAKYMEKWRAWAGRFGKALVNPVVPFKGVKAVSSGGVSDNNSSNRLTGYSVVQADSMDAAIEMAKGCPHLEHGTVDVAEAMEMNH